MTTNEHNGRTRFGRAIRLLLTFTAVVGGLIAVTAAPAAAQLPPPDGGCALTSTRGGTIHRCEAMYRALTWYDIRYNSDMTYSQTSFHADYNNTDTYRKDCSGFVDMAWHLSTDPATDGLPGISTKLASFKDMKAGDILDYPKTSSHAGHTLLFKEWVDSAHTTFNYYTFGYTYIRLVLNETITGGSDGLIDDHTYSVYTPYRYNKMAD